MEQLITVTEARQMYKSGSKTDAGNEGFLVLKNINKIYPNKVQAVYDFNLAVRRNEFIVLVGPSGCGKSTTLRMIAGLEEITSGYLYIDGVTANYLASKDRDIAMVFQNYALYPNMTVFENIAFSLEMKKTEDVRRDKSGNVVTDSVGNPIKIMRNYTKEEIRKKVFEVAEILDLGAYLDRKPKELSGGQMQRVALGRAIVRNAKLFLMDEPLSNLDAKLRVQMRSEIVKLHKNVHATTVYVTHDQTEAMTMADRIVIMNKGFIQQIGAPKDVYNDPCNVFVAMFIGNPPMNVKEVATNGNSLVNGNERIALPETVSPAYKKFLEQRLAYFTELAEKADTTAEHELAAKIHEFVHTYGKNSDRGTLVSLCEALLQADKRGLYRFDEQGRDNLLKLFDCGDKGLRVQLAHIAAGLDDVDFVVKGILDGECSMMNSTARKDDGKTQNKGKTKDKKPLAVDVAAQNKADIQEYLNRYSAEAAESNSLLVGIRPENIHIAAEYNGNKSATFTAAVDFVELLGSEYCVHVKAFDNEFILKLDNAHTVAVGDELQLCFNLDRLKIFDKISGKSII